MTESPGFDVLRGSRDGDEIRLKGRDGAYFATPELVAVVNAAIALERPLLITGDPGCGKTGLAYAIAAELGLAEPLRYDVRSDSQGRDLLYRFDSLGRYWDVQNRDSRAERLDRYVKKGVLGRAFEREERSVVLIDEIDKAGRDFPNDLLQALDESWFEIRELDPPLPVRAKMKPIVVATSNRENQLPPPFLRRCVFCYIALSEELLARIVEERFPVDVVNAQLRGAVLARFRELSKMNDLERKPSTAELLDWVRVLERSGAVVADLERGLSQLPHLGTLLKSEDDLKRARSSKPTP